MKKKHMQHKSGLFIGLFSLAILSSCVNTRQKLGIDGSFNRQEQQSSNRDNAQQARQELSVDSTSNQQEEQGNNRYSLQQASKFQHIRTAFRATVNLLAEFPLEDLIIIAERFMIGYTTTKYLIDSLMYIAGYNEGSLDARIANLNKMQSFYQSPYRSS